MKLLFDQNISRKLVKDLRDIYPGSKHVYTLNLYQKDDEEIWAFAKDYNFIIVTQDSDFYERSLLYGFPPKIIWLRTGNISTNNIKKILRDWLQNIIFFAKDKTLGCLEIY
ncbi:hypothetical protein A2954_03505 [Candidatus Roizmanbacteria bacterium RIFCSPLOWO2_01_FULL_37_12]|uniref:DUF5615 domain-containing protein n=1 Tax=Candidatus Roizmanbacteria bacterium RIFCSPLOWO2_01_FULL_37_12 TaxID=1802056 RepID=A0A1F7IF73_9BACT|nr:MAG: hypothetical protein A3D76_06715 [Candidatus Roizmanbacteria bacterium RIFCSPHIGHO2_02_FULL_37_9b]OGK42033.1 MAG: hypothetical protein A2954_03505 [Candidatus Roizmanbacteria bacterium RIFCSPLOWO2_01_FULL_37_12]